MNSAMRTIAVTPMISTAKQQNFFCARGMGSQMAA